MHSKIGTAEQYTPRKNAFGVMDPIDRVMHIMAADRLERIPPPCMCVCVYVCVCLCVEMLTPSLHF